MNIKFPSYFEPVPETDKIYPLVSSGITLFLSVMVELVIEYLRCRITKILSQLAELSGCEFLLLFPQESSSRRSSSVLIFYPKFPDIFSTRFFFCLLRKMLPSALVVARTRESQLEVWLVITGATQPALARKLANDKGKKQIINRIRAFRKQLSFPSFSVTVLK